MNDKPQPGFTADGVPWCASSCSQHDGKRCMLLGSPPGVVCIPAVRAMADALTAPAFVKPTQPAPKPIPEGEVTILDLVISDIEDRDRLGRAKYGQPLHVDNGRDALLDAYEESLDKTFYLKQAILQRDRAEVRIELDVVEINRLIRWVKGHVCDHAEGPLFTITEKPSSGLGSPRHVSCACGALDDITDYDTW